MKQFIASFCEIGFWLSAPCLLFCRAKFEKFKWWMLYLCISLGCWGLVCVGLHFHYSSISDKLNEYYVRDAMPPQELLDGIASDSAPRAFALVFGWLYGPIYSIPWLFIYGAYRVLFKRKI